MMPKHWICAWRAHAQRKHAIPHSTMTYNWPHRGAVHIDRTCIVVMVLCNQPEAFALDLGDDQSRYLLSSYWEYRGSSITSCTWLLMARLTESSDSWWTSLAVATTLLTSHHSHGVVQLLCWMFYINCIS